MCKSLKMKAYSAGLVCRHVHMMYLLTMYLLTMYLLTSYYQSALNTKLNSLNYNTGQPQEVPCVLFLLLLYKNMIQTIRLWET